VRKIRKHARLGADLFRVKATMFGIEPHLIVFSLVFFWFDVMMMVCTKYLPKIQHFDHWIFHPGSQNPFFGNDFTIPVLLAS